VRPLGSNPSSNRSSLLASDARSAPGHNRRSGPESASRGTRKHHISLFYNLIALQQLDRVSARKADGAKKRCILPAR
jgi:hypothetical protein